MRLSKNYSISINKHHPENKSRLQREEVNTNKCQRTGQHQELGQQGPGAPEMTFREEERRGPTVFVSSQKEAISNTFEIFQKI